MLATDLQTLRVVELSRCSLVASLIVGNAAGSVENARLLLCAQDAQMAYSCQGVARPDVHVDTQSACVLLSSAGTILLCPFRLLSTVAISSFAFVGLFFPFCRCCCFFCLGEFSFQTGNKQEKKQAAMQGACLRGLVLYGRAGGS